MRARDIASPHIRLSSQAPASEAAAALSRLDVRAVLVVDAAGDLAGVLTDGRLLAVLLPEYLEEDPALARVLEEDAGEGLRRRLEGRTVGDLLEPGDGPLPQVEGDARPLEVAAMMVRTHLSLVGVVDHGELIGGISIDDLLAYLLAPR